MKHDSVKLNFPLYVWTTLKIRNGTVGKIFIHISIPIESSPSLRANIKANHSVSLIFQENLESTTYTVHDCPQSDFLCNPSAVLELVNRRGATPVKWSREAGNRHAKEYARGETESARVRVVPKDFL